LCENFSFDGFIRRFILAECGPLAVIAEQELSVEASCPSEIIVLEAADYIVEQALPDV
jgi:hypothetical protein